MAPLWKLPRLFPLLLAGILLGMPATAQEREEAAFVELPRPLREISRLARPAAERHEKTEPVRWGGFVLYPKVALDQGYTSNLYASETNEKDDFFTDIKPSLYVEKQLGRHKADLLVEGRIRQHWDHQDENVTDVHTRLGALLEARRDLIIPLELSYKIGHEARDQNYSANFTQKPLQYKAFGAGIGIAYKPNRLGLSLQGRYSDLAYDDGISAQTRQPVLRSDSDRSRYEGEFKLSYDLGANHTPFVTLTAGQTDYPHADRDSTDLGAMAGWAFSYKGLIDASIAAGKGKRAYDSRALKDISSFDAQADINWNIAKVATLKLNYNRSLLEDNDAVAGALSSRLHLGLDYEFTRRILLTTYVEKSWLDYENSTRRDEITGGGFGVRYQFNPYHSVSAEYDHRLRDSTSPGIDYSRDVYMLRYNMRF